MEDNTHDRASRSVSAYQPGCARCGLDVRNCAFAALDRDPDASGDAFHTMSNPNNCVFVTKGSSGLVRRRA